MEIKNYWDLKIKEDTKFDYKAYAAIGDKRIDHDNLECVSIITNKKIVLEISLCFQ